VELRDAGASIAAFEAWLQLGGEGGQDEEALRRIERYNRDDVVSTRLLRDWLEARRPELSERIHVPVPRPEPTAGEAREDLSETLKRVEELAARLTEGVPVEERSADQHARWLLAQLLSWHRREDKAFWWRYYHLMQDLTDEERIAEREPIGGLEYVGVVDEVKLSLVHRYRFPPQEHGLHEGMTVHDPATGKSAGTVVSVDDGACTVDVKRKRDGAVPHPTSLVPCEHIGANEQQQSLFRIGEWVVDHGIDGEGSYRVARDLLRRLPPRAGQISSQPLQVAGESTLEAAIRAVMALDESTLAIQGPPGSGKTYTGARAVLALVAAGRRVGVTANSHKVIGHFLDEVVQEAEKCGAAIRIGQKPENGGECTCAKARCFKSNAELLAALTGGELDVVGGTAWVWSREEFAGSLDALIVDEAGQISLANAIAVSPAARSLVLLGDPQQLDQPLKGTHPPGAERSALAHLLNGAATMPGDRGLFLPTTRRLHPDICTFTSEVFYEGRLEPEAGLERQSLAGCPPLTGTGVRFLPVVHRGNRSDSPEEADAILRMVTELLAGKASWVDCEGKQRDLASADIVIVAPYNDQVGEIARRLPDARVGTVDKFQGQQAAISIYSMATSSPAEAPRGMEFLYSLNRLNVATSRARCLAVLVANPDLVRVRCRTPRQMRLANALARLVEMAGSTRG